MGLAARKPPVGLTARHCPWDLGMRSTRKAQLAPTCGGKASSRSKAGQKLNTTTH